jgi:hypothetical protein
MGGEILAGGLGSCARHDSSITRSSLTGTLSGGPTAGRISLCLSIFPGLVYPCTSMGDHIGLHVIMMRKSFPSPETACFVLKLAH